MPLYEYECESCGERFEIIQKFADPPAEVCGKCGKGPVVRLLSSPAIQFKGSGWYVTDYAKKSSADTAKSNGEKSAKTDGATTDSAKTESAKSESGPGASASTPAPPSPATPDKK